MRTVLLPPGVNPIAVNKYIISYHMIFVPKWFPPSGVPINNTYKEDKFIPIHAMKA
jgi:hypothetical protein